MNNQNSFNDTITKLEDTLDVYFRQKAPALPANVKEIIVAIVPWFALIAVIITILGIVASLGLLPLSFLGGLHVGMGFGLSTLFTIVIVTLEGLAVDGLFKKEKKAWRYMFYVTLLMIVQNIIMFDVAGLIIGGALSLYVLFQTKEYYTN